ncbi:MAG: hypothetical protein FWF81_12275 [Defluviitaleaceae bacterium]|nr:hypothetical protein [Defluviitaleaceae bacterium]
MYINIEIERVRRHLSRAEMARLLAVDTDILQNWIRRRSPIPAKKLRALSQLFDGVSVDYLLATAKKSGKEVNICTHLHAASLSPSQGLQ